MSIVHGLAVILIVFEGNIIQCEGNDNKIASSSTIHDSPQLIPWIRITPDKFCGENREYENDKGELVNEVGSLEELLSFYEKHGGRINKIELEYGSPKNTESRDVSHQNIRKYGQYLKELKIVSKHDGEVWHELTGGDENIFPNIEKFKCVGNCREISFRINIIFRRNLLIMENADLTDLVVLQMCNTPIQEHQYIPIFEDNGEMTRLVLSHPNRPETMRAIANFLKKLESFHIIQPGREFFLNNKKGNKLPSVTHLYIEIFHIADIVEDPSFEMPNLTTLTLSVKKMSEKSDLVALEKIDFTARFEKLEIISFVTKIYESPRIVRKIKNIFTDKQWTLTNDDHNLIEQTLMFHRQPLKFSIIAD